MSMPGIYNTGEVQEVEKESQTDKHGQLVQGTL